MNVRIMRVIQNILKFHSCCYYRDCIDKVCNQSGNARYLSIVFKQPTIRYVNEPRHLISPKNAIHTLY